MTIMRDLLVHKLQDLYSAEHQLTKAMPTMVRAATAPLLATALRDHLKETERHVLRLEECFLQLNEPARAAKGTGMEGLLQEGGAMATGEGNPLESVANLLRLTLEDERAADARLSSIANTGVNAKAMLSAENVGVS